MSTITSEDKRRFEYEITKQIRSIVDEVPIGRKPEALRKCMGLRRMIESGPKSSQQE